MLARPRNVHSGQEPRWPQNRHESPCLRREMHLLRGGPDIPPARNTSRYQSGGVEPKVVAMTAGFGVSSGWATGRAFSGDGAEGPPTRAHIAGRRLLTFLCPGSDPDWLPRCPVSSRPHAARHPADPHRARLLLEAVHGGRATREQPLTPTSSREKGCIRLFPEEGTGKQGMRSLNLPLSSRLVGARREVCGWIEPCYDRRPAG
jgi:hypothetical protein